MKVLVCAVLLSATAATARRSSSVIRYLGDLAPILAQLPKDAAGKYLVGTHLVKIGRKKMEIFVPDDNQSTAGANHMEESQSPLEHQQHKRDPQEHLANLLKRDPQEHLVNLNERRDLEPVIGREREINGIKTALKLKDRKLVVLIGEPGVGKTAIVEGLVRRIVTGELPELAGREIFSLNVGEMWGEERNMFVGQLQGHVSDVLKFVAAKPEQRILFIDEIHQLIGGGQTSHSEDGGYGSLRITDIFKSMGSGNLCCIGTTTHDEYQAYIERDTAIKDRLYPIYIDEPSPEDTFLILQGIKTRYEEHHRVLVSDDALRAAVNLSTRYLPAEKQPRKAIALLDKAAAAAEIEDVVLDKGHIVAGIAEKTGLPVETILKSKNDKFAGLLPALQQQIYGQDDALKEIADTLSIAFAGIKGEKKPMAVFLLGGPTGSGKTQTAKTLAGHLFDHEGNLITINMNTYGKTDNTKELIASLIKAVKKTPYAVILLDEAEKADSIVLGGLLQLLDEGLLSDSRNRPVDFTNTIIILTTNSRKNQVDFSDEVRGRLNIITYKHLDKDATTRLVQKQLDELNVTLQKEKQITLTLSDTAVEILVQMGYSWESGAREMGRTFEKLIKVPLAAGIYKDLITNGNIYHIALTRESDMKVEVTITANGEVVLKSTVPVATQK